MKNERVKRDDKRPRLIGSKLSLEKADVTESNFHRLLLHQANGKILLFMLEMVTQTGS